MSNLSTAILFVSTFFNGGHVPGQDSLSIRDASEIRYKAEKMVKTELNELLNSLTNTGYETHEVAESIHASYSESRNRIFRDSLVVVEPDVNPGFQTSSQAGDESVEKYLRDIDLLYKKSDSASIVFDNIRSSAVKKNEGIYVKVYFNSLWKGKSAVSDQAYSMTNRIAEIMAEKNKGQWRLYIVRLGFYDPADTAADVANNIPIMQTSTSDEGQLEKVTRQLQEQERSDSERYTQLLLLGDNAYRQKDLTTALNQYTEAQNLQPNAPEVNLRLKTVNTAIAKSKVEAAQLYAGLIEKARMQENNRQYKEAIDNYQNAVKLRPEEAGRLQPHIRELTDRFATLSDLQEKFNAGYIKEALKEYTEAIKKDPNNSDYYLGRGRCHEKLTEEPKNIALALKDYTQAYDLDHNNLSAIRYRADLYAATGDYFKALSDYKIYLTIDRTNIEVYEKKSAMHVQLKLYNEAIADLDEALAIDPKAAHVYLSKGILLLTYSKQDNREDIRKAADNFTACLRIDSSNVQALFNRGRCDLLLHQFTEAAADFGSAREKGLDTASLRIVSNYAVTYYNQAASQFGRRNVDSAISYIDVAIAIDPDSPLYRCTRGDYSYARVRYSDAIGSYDRAIQLNPAYVQAYYKRAQAYYQLSKYKEAIADLESARKLEPENLFVVRGEGDAWRALKDYPRAIAGYENALRIATNARTPVGPPVMAELYNILGYCYFATSEYDKTISFEKKAIAADRNLADAYFNRGYAYYRLGQLGDAIEDLNRAISMLDKRAEWHYVLGRVYLDKKDFSNAAAQFDEYLKRDKDIALPDAVYRTGYCQYMLHNYAAALPFYTQYLALHQDTAQARFPLEIGVIYLNIGKYDSAYYYGQKAWQQDNTDGYACYVSGSALALQGKVDESIAWFERSFQRKDPGYSEIKRDKLLADIRNNNKKFKELLKKYY